MDDDKADFNNHIIGKKIVLTDVLSANPSSAISVFKR